MKQVVVTQVASTSRGMPADELGELAAGVFGAERVTVAPRLDDAIETAVNLAEADDVGAPGVLVTGSVVRSVRRGRCWSTSSSRRRRTTTDDPDDDWDADDADDGETGRANRRRDGRRLAGDRARPGNPMRVVLLSVLIFEVIVFGLAVPVMILVSGVSPDGRRLGGGAAAAGPGRGRPAAQAGRLPGRLGRPSRSASLLGLLTPAMFVVGGDVRRLVGADLRAGQAAGRARPPPARAQLAQPARRRPAASRPARRRRPRSGRRRCRARRRPPSVGLSTSSVTPSADTPAAASAGANESSAADPPKNRSSSTRPSSGPADMCTPLKFELTLSPGRRPPGRRTGCRGSSRRPPWPGRWRRSGRTRSASQSVALLPCRNAHTVSSAVKKLSCRGWKPFRMITGRPSTVTAPAYVPGPSRPT